MEIHDALSNGIHDALSRYRWISVLIFSSRKISHRKECRPGEQMLQGKLEGELSKPHGKHIMLQDNQECTVDYVCYLWGNSHIELAIDNNKVADTFLFLACCFD